MAHKPVVATVKLPVSLHTHLPGLRAIVNLPGQIRKIEHGVNVTLRRNDHQRPDLRLDSLLLFVSQRLLLLCRFLFVIH
ncbi:MAG TPA: hypothetical protein VKV37_23155 [Ktedonobacteraceae bacterium]|nr:hypothetical protein [Ktedonobacteraceae bacterium]